MQIGILQTGASPDALRADMGDYPDFFERLLADRGLTFRRFHVEAMEFPKDVHDCEGWLITGSRHGAYEDHPFIKPLEAFIRQAYAAQVPVVGICFGHQIIAQAMGGKVERYAGGWSVGPTDYDFNGEKITLNAWHRDQVTEKPAVAEVVATNEFCTNAALLYDDRMFTVQAHPEFRPEFVDGLMRTRGPGLVPDELMAQARARLADPLDDQTMAGRIAAFFLNHQNTRSSGAEKLRA
ncbi:type 1 glutamine amidotransferase [Pseudogemmobacter blasticus]|uniref:Glutamine amidotransferase n=1 Tax=Fuscovulum blasticum DSM 2131 TaxID=1188250 RepID=A0A2T4J907_FUSBL|nr:type 1 glutamine amidotransferase [Fuscovulum blasticum]PTE14396.1 glutamine amidotransferase [Fuscovulum blasticum DSM 2131]